MKKIKPIHVLMLKRITCSVLLQRERERERQIEEMFATPKTIHGSCRSSISSSISSRPQINTDREWASRSNTQQKDAGVLDGDSPAAGAG